MDHAGLPLKIVLEQLDILAGEVMPALRKEFAENRPERVPDGPNMAHSSQRERQVPPQEATVRQLQNQGIRVQLDTIELRDHVRDVTHNMLAGSVRD